LCLRLFAGSTSLLTFDRGQQACLYAPIRNLQSLSLTRDVRPRNCQTNLSRPQLYVVQRDFGSNGYLHVAQTGGTGAGACFTGGQCLMVSTKNIWLPAGIKPAEKELAGAVVPDLLRCAAAEALIFGIKAAALTSRTARAWRNAACAL
jgi:hypothetical protein